MWQMIEDKLFNAVQWAMSSPRNFAIGVLVCFGVYALFTIITNLIPRKQHFDDGD